MKKLVASVVCFACAVLMLHCQQTTEVKVDDTEVRVTNDLSGITLADGFEVDSVVVHGLEIGDVTFSRVSAGQTTDYVVTEEYGSAVEMTADSLTVYPRKDGLRLMPVVVRDVGTYQVTITRYGENTITLDETVIPISELFGTTRVRIANKMLNVTVSFGSSTTTCDSVHLYGVSLANCAFDMVMAGDTTAYDTCDAAGTVTLAVDSIVGVGDLMGDGTVLVWNTVDSIEVDVDELVSNTVTIGSGTPLLSGLGTPSDIRGP